MAWRDYQESIAQFFRELGCEAAVEAQVRGARASHKIDVWVTFRRFGLHHKWVIECKDWRTRVPKEKVIALKGVVDDVGADRGILVAESGFQSGARQAASFTNVALLTPAELRNLARADFLSGLLEKIESRMADLYQRFENLLTVDDEGGYYFNRGRYSILETGLKRARLGRFPVLIGVTAPPRDEGILAKDLRDLVEKAAQAIDEIEQWIETQEQTIHRNAG